MADLVGQTLGHYRIVEKIGAGGMGVVYRAHDDRLDRDVAIKVLPETVASDPDRLARFEREARAVARLAHPNILDIHELGGLGGQPYMVTEVLDGETLRERLQGGQLGWRKAAEVGAAIADGLAAAHQAGVVHRDLKPANVFLTTDGRIKVLDFGLAKLVRSADATAGGTETPTTPMPTASGTVMGTVGYMAPEQVMGHPADARSDIFSLGCVLYEMITGRRAFARDTPTDTLTAILRDDPPQLVDCDLDVSAELSHLVAHCLEKKPDQRFQSARDLAFALRRLLGGPEVEATPLAAPRVRWQTVAAVAVLLVLACVVTVLVLERSRPRSREDEPRPEPPRIVVLPFDNLGPPEDAFFADGMSEEITSRLAMVSGLTVISRTSAMQYKENRPGLQQIGQELDVAWVLEGTVRWDRASEGHGRVRITPQLIRVADDSHLWSERYDRVLEDIFEVQSDIAEQVIDQLQVTLLEPEQRALETRPTDNMDAYQAYLAGLHRKDASADEKGYRLAVDMLERAVELDPGFALAHAALSQLYSQLYYQRYELTPQCLDKARLAAERALALEPGLPEAHRALGWYHYLGFRDYDRALEEFEIAARSLPNDPDLVLGTFATYRRMGRWQEALAQGQKGVELNPRGYAINIEHAYTYYLLHQYDRAAEYLDRAIAIAPDRSDAYAKAAWNYLKWDGNTARARALLANMPGLDSPDVEEVALVLDFHDRNWPSALRRLESTAIEGAYTGYVPVSLLECRCRREMHETELARAACEQSLAVLRSELEERPWDYRMHSALGLTYALLGRKDEAVQAGEHAVEAVPISKDARDGPGLVEGLAKIYAQVGEAEKALDLIEQLLAMPSYLSVGMLRFDPAWDPLRDDPRFQALLNQNVPGS